MDKFLNPEFVPPEVTWQTMQPVIPAILVILAGIVAFVFEMVQRKRSNSGAVISSLIGLLIAGWFVASQFGSPAMEVLSGTALRDQMGLALQLLLIGSCFLAVLFSEGYLREKHVNYGECYPLMLWAAAGAMIMVSSKNLLTVFLGLEVLSIALYVLSGLSRSEAKSEESALKYFLLGAFASAFLLYGIAFFYGATGSLHLDAIAKAWTEEPGAMQNLMVFGLGMMLIGLAFKSAFVPFHQWTPDVYQGAPTNVTAFMAASSKIAAIGALYRVLDASAPMREAWLPGLFWIAILTMTVGNLTAVVQRDVKRILAYSSIAHAGYVLVALLAHSKKPDTIGSGSTVFYLFAYSAMTVGAFAVISLIAKAGKEGTRLSDLNGLWKRSPGLAVALVLFMASLIGIPGTAGFMGKLLIFTDAVDAGLTSLAIVLAVNSVISIYYYLGIALAAFVSEEASPDVPVSKPNPGLLAATTLCSMFVIGGFLFSGKLLMAFTEVRRESPVSVMGSPLPSSLDIAKQGESTSSETLASRR